MQKNFFPPKSAIDLNTVSPRFTTVSTYDVLRLRTHFKCSALGSFVCTFYYLHYLYILLHFIVHFIVHYCIFVHFIAFYLYILIALFVHFITVPYFTVQYDMYRVIYV